MADEIGVEIKKPGIRGKLTDRDKIMMYERLKFIRESLCTFHTLNAL